MRRTFQSIDLRLALIPIIWVAALVRVYDLGEESIWVDEAFSVRMANLSPGRMIDQVITLDIHPPLYYLLLHYWVSIFGTSEIAVRSLSALLGLATIAMAYKVGELLGGVNVGLLTALLVAFSAFHLEYSQEARSYSLMALLATASFYFFLQILAGKRSAAWIPYFLVSLALMYTHAYGLFIIVAQNVFLLAYLASSRVRGAGSKPTLARWIVLQASLVLAYIPWILVWIRWTGEELAAGESANTAVLALPSPDMLVENLERYSGGFKLLVVIAVIFTVALGSWLGRRPRGQIQTSELVESRQQYRLGAEGRLVLLVLWLATPILLPFLLSFVITPMYYSPMRQTIGASIAFYLLLALGLTSFRNRGVVTAGILLVVLGSMFYVWQYHHESRKHDWRNAVSFVDSYAARGDLVLFNVSYTQDAFDYYSKGREFDEAVIAKTRVDFGADHSELRAAAERYGRIWLIVPYHDPGLMAVDLVKRELDQSHEERYHLGPRYFHNLDIAVLERIDRSPD